MASNRELKKTPDNQSPRSTKMSSEQRLIITHLLLSDKSSNHLIEMEDKGDIDKQLENIINNIINALQTQAKMENEFYFLSTAFNDSGKAFRRIQDSGGQITEQDIKLFILDYVNLEIDRTIKEVITQVKNKSSQSKEDIEALQKKLQEPWSTFYNSQKKLLSGEKQTVFENKKITFEEEIPIIEDLKKEAEINQLQLTLTEEKAKTTTGEETEQLIRFIVISSNDIDSKESAKLPSSEVKIFIPTNHFAAQQFYDHTVPRMYFDLAKQLRSLSKDKIFRLALTKTSDDSPYLMEVKLPTIDEKGLKTDIILESKIDSRDSLGVFLTNRVDTIHSEASEFESGFVKIAKYLSPEWKEPVLSPALKKLILDKNYYRLFENKKINLSDLQDIDLNTVNFLIKSYKNISKLIDEELISAKTLKKLTSIYLESINLIADLAIRQHIKGTILDYLKPKDMEILSKMQKFTNEQEIVDYMLATAALRKKGDALPDVKLFQDAKDNTVLNLELSQEGLLKLIKRKLLTQHLIEQLDASQLAKITTGIEKIKDRSIALQYLFVSGLLTVDQIMKIPKVELEKYEELKTIPQELLEFKPNAKDMRTVSFKALINNFSQLAQAGIVDESDLYTVFKNHTLKNLLATPQLNDPRTVNPKLTAFCLDSLIRQIEFTLSFPESTLGSSQLTEKSLNKHFDTLISNCEQRGLKGAPELINNTRYSIQILDALRQLAHTDPEWDEEHEENASEWNNEWEDDADNFVAETKATDNFKGIGPLTSFNFDKLIQFIDKFQAINWNKQEEGKLESLTGDISTIFDASKESKLPSDPLQKWALIFEKITADNFVNNIEPAIKFAKASFTETSFVKPLEHLNRMLTEAITKKSEYKRVAGLRS